MKPSIYSAPGEEYEKHIDLCLENLEIILPVYLARLKEVLSFIDETLLRDAFTKMMLYHDLGKLTRKWQENLGARKHLPSHSTLGACYLWKTLPEGLKEPVGFAVLIHHTDKGLLGDNIERPAEQAILDGIVDFDGKIDWHGNARKLNERFFPGEARGLTVNDLRDMAVNLRIWARGDSFLEQHQRRLQAMVCHHVLKLCDISAAVDRREYQRDNEDNYFGGWLMVEEIKRYVENIKGRGKRCNL